jgi:hypothetical protein
MRCGGHLSLSLGLHIQCVDPSGKLPTIALPQTKKISVKIRQKFALFTNLKKINFSCEVAYAVSGLVFTWV